MFILHYCDKAENNFVALTHSVRVSQSIVVKTWQKSRSWDHPVEMLLHIAVDKEAERATETNAKGLYGLASCRGLSNGPVAQLQSTC